MAVRPPRAAPVARNLVIDRVPRFVGDPPGEAITQGVLRGVTPSLAGRTGFIYAGDESSMERAWHGYAANPQPVLEARQFTMRSGTPAVFVNGPNDASSTISGDAGAPFLDARYRALAQRMMRSG